MIQLTYVSIATITMVTPRFCTRSNYNHVVINNPQLIIRVLNFWCSTISPLRQPISVAIATITLVTPGCFCFSAGSIYEHTSGDWNSNVVLRRRMYRKEVTRWISNPRSRELRRRVLNPLRCTSEKNIYRGLYENFVKMDQLFTKKNGVTHCSFSFVHQGQNQEQSCDLDVSCWLVPRTSTEH